MTVYASSVQKWRQDYYPVVQMEKLREETWFLQGHQLRKAGSQARLPYLPFLPAADIPSGLGPWRDWASDGRLTPGCGPGLGLLAASSRGTCSKAPASRVRLSFLAAR